MTDALPPYSDDHPTCPKCRHAGATTEYQAAGLRTLAVWDDEVIPHGPLPEHLQRECRRCDYRWIEALAEPAHAEDGTDLGRLLGLLKRFGIPAAFDGSCGDPTVYHLALTAGEDGVEGEHPGLYCLFEFDIETSAFKTVGVWAP